MVTQTRSVDYDLEVVDELPHQEATRSSSPLADQLARIKFDAHRHAPKWGRIAKYSSVSHTAAAQSTAKALRRKHGDDESVEGWRFEVRKLDNGTATGVFAQYDSEKIIPGKKEQNDLRFKEYQQRQTEARKRRIAEKMLNEGTVVDDDWEDDPR